MKDQYLNNDYNERQGAVKSFVKSLSEKETNDLVSIITHYLSYREETVEAALIVSVDKGLISYDLKEQLWKQIESGFALQNKPVKNYRWESDNAFTKYVAGYTDEEIYNILEDPNDIVIDVYHAFLLIAKERELISSDDFTKYYDDARLASEGEEVKMQYDIADLFRSETPISDEPDEAEIEAEMEKYWKCPNCNEMVGIEFGECWNCAAEVPELIEYPDKNEVIEEITPRRHYTPLSIGFRLLGAGVLVIVLDFFRHNRYGSTHWTHLGGYIFGGFFILMGLGFIFYSTFSKSVKD